MVLGPTPLIVVGILLALAGARLLNRPTVLPAARALGTLLVLRGTLNLVAALWWVPATFDAATRLWPLLDVGVAGLALYVAYRIRRRDQPVQTGDGTTIPAFLALVTGLAVFALAVRPALWWGTATTDGAWSFLNGLKFVGYASVAAALVGPVAPLSRLDATRRARLVLATLLALDVVHWATTDLLLVEAAGFRLADVRTGPDHYGRLLAVPVLGLVLLRLAGQAWVAVHPPRRAAARWSILACLLVVVAAVGILHAVGLGWIGTVAANTAIVLTLDAVWTLPVAGWVLFAPSLRAVHDAVGTRRGVTDRLVFPDAT